MILNKVLGFCNWPWQFLLCFCYSSAKLHNSQEKDWVHAIASLQHGLFLALRDNFFIAWGKVLAWTTGVIEGTQAGFGVPVPNTSMPHNLLVVLVVQARRNGCFHLYKIFRKMPDSINITFFLSYRDLLWWLKLLSLMPKKIYMFILCPTLMGRIWPRLMQH